MVQKIDKRDVFISHASEDKKDYVYALVEAFKNRKITYWLDDAEINWGDRITRKINEGIEKSRFVLVLLSENFLEKNWPMSELEAAMHKENSSGKKIVLPVFIASENKIFSQYPLLRDKMYLKWRIGVKKIAQRLAELLSRDTKNVFNGLKSTESKITKVSEDVLPISSWHEPLNDSIKIEMITLQRNSFLMGSPDEKFTLNDKPHGKITRISNKKIKILVDTVDRFAECPAHNVNLSSFAISRYPITQEQWEELMDNNPSETKGKNNPVENISWEDAKTFCRKLNEKTGKNYRLPTEAEWEYACRGGIYDDYGFKSAINKLSDYAWYGHMSEGTCPVGLKKPNNYGIYDMHGNVWEWCEDHHHPRYYKFSLSQDPRGPKMRDLRCLGEVRMPVKVKLAEPHFVFSNTLNVIFHIMDLE